MRKCVTREYRDISKTNIDKILTEAASHGAVIKGFNPWDIDTRLHGAVLRIRWDEQKMTMAISVVNVNWYIPSETVWNNIDSMLDGYIRKKNNRDVAFDTR
ncbi:MAG: hypothetical protein WA946_14705 [Nitrospirota bacterium]